MKSIRIGTDCSGIEAPIQALQKLGIPFKHVFSSDIDKYCRESILANYEPEILYEDLTKRDNSKVPDIDLYICGFPCQSFSIAGKRKGMKEKRGQIFWHCVDLIETKRPAVFILENVKGLLTINDGKTFNKIIKTLEEINGYTIQYALLNTKDFGIPQHRERIYIIGTKFQFDFQLPQQKMKSLASFVDKTDTLSKSIPPYVIKTGLLSRIPPDSIFIDINFALSSFPNSNLYSPSITTAGLWCVPMQRNANIKELLALQNFPKSFKQVVSNTQMKKQIGNSMSVCVLLAIFKMLYKA